LLSFIVFDTYIRLFCEFIGAPQKKYISKRTKSDFWLGELVRLQLRILKTNKLTFVEFSRYSGYILQVSWTRAKLLASNCLRILCTKIIQIGSSLTELSLFKKL